MAQRYLRLTALEDYCTEIFSPSESLKVDLTAENYVQER
jgi:hypothetical protein